MSDAMDVGHSVAYLLQMTINITCQFSEEHSEQICQQRSGKVQSFLSKMVTVIQLSPFHGGKKESVDHVPKEVGLL
jgi:hypothetical protein